MRANAAWCVLLGLLAVAECTARQAGRDPKAPVGTVAAVTGEVTYTTAKAPAPRPATVGLAVTREMTFKTGPGASLEVKLDNGYTWKLAENRERAIAKLRVVDLPRAEGGAASVLDDEESDRTAGAGRHAEPSAADTAATTTAVAPAESPRPPPPPPPPAPAPAPTPEPAAPGGGGGVATKPPPPDPTDPTHSTDDVYRTLAQHQPKMKACLDGSDAKGQVVVTFTVGKNGRVTDASASGDLAGTPAAACVLDVVRGVRFARRDDPATFRVKFDASP